MKCPCQSAKSYAECCEPFIKGAAFPETAEALMRSRYTAYTQVDVPYIKSTMAPETRTDFDPAATKEWAETAEWSGLKILSTKKGGAGDKKGTVEFTATYKVEGKTLEHHEVSEFRKNSLGHWMFVDGDSHVHEDGHGHNHHAEPAEPVAIRPKIGRNDPCTCGSGKKFKQCCANAA